MTLDLSSNQLSASIPSELCGLAALRGLYLDYNLRFNTSSVATASRVVLRLYGRLSATTGTPVTTAVYSVASTTWSETGTTWNNKPAAGTTALASVSMDIATTTARWYEWDVTAYAQQEKAAGRHTISLALKNLATSTPNDTFSSRQATSNKPALVITP